MQQDLGRRGPGRSPTTVLTIFLVPLIGWLTLANSKGIWGIERPEDVIPLSGAEEITLEGVALVEGADEVDDIDLPWLQQTKNWARDAAFGLAILDEPDLTAARNCPFCLGFAPPVDLPVIVPNFLDLGPQDRVSLLTRRGLARIGPHGAPRIIAALTVIEGNHLPGNRWGDLQGSANRLAPMNCPVIVDKRDHGLNGRSSSVPLRGSRRLRR